MIKTDKVIYHTKTQEEYDWLMDGLDKADCEWLGGGSPISGKEVCNLTKSDSYICVENETISFLDREYWDFHKNAPVNKDDELIEVSDIMESETKAEILDKLEVMNKYLENKLKKIEEEDDKSQKVKKVVYTTEVYFE